MTKPLNELTIVEEWLKKRKFVAIGEIGIDLYWDKTFFKEQQHAFKTQIQWALNYNYPIIIHCRDAYEDVLAILKVEYAGLPGVIHSFTDTWDTAKQFLDFGFHVALNGILTFDKTGKLAEVVEKPPLDRLLTETDAPYLTPPPFRPDASRDVAAASRGSPRDGRHAVPARAHAPADA